MAKSRKKIWKSVVWAIFLLLFAAFCFYSNNCIEITEFEQYSTEIPKGFDGFKIVHLSDLHNKTFISDNTPLLEEIRALDPDIIVTTGDMIDCSNHTNVKKAELFLSQAVEIAPTYYVTGNHEMMLEDEMFQAFALNIQSFGVRYLNSECVKLTAENGDNISLIGVGDEKLFTNSLQNIMAEENPSDYQILLAHEPQILQDYANAGVDMVFTGHAHGGQFRIPFLHQGLYAPDQGILPRKTEGKFSEKDTVMYVSRGLGNSGFPLRLFNRPEIICVTLKSE